MSSMRQAIADDEEEWDQLIRAAQIDDARWGVYSPEADFARDGFQTLGFTGHRLRLHVRHQMELKALATQHRQELAEFEQYTQLSLKFSE